MLFEEKSFSSHILLTDQISLSDCLYLLSIWQYLYFNYLCLSFWGHKFWNLAFLSSHFQTKPENSGQECKQIKNRKSFVDEIKSFIHHFLRALQRKIKSTSLKIERQTFIVFNSKGETSFDLAGQKQALLKIAPVTNNASH